MQGKRHLSSGWRFGLPALLLLGLVSAVLASSLGPVLGVTGVPMLGKIPAEPTCNQSQCHTGNPMNFNGLLEILGLPQTYSPGADYTVTVRLSSTANQNNIGRHWGFELTAVNLADGLGGGAFSSSDLLIRNGDPRNGNRTYVSHDPNTLHPGETSPVEWSFTWTAPAENAGDIGFYAAGNAANGDMTNTGDFIYTASATAAATVPVKRATWGRLKTRWPG